MEATGDGEGEGVVEDCFSVIFVNYKNGMQY